MKTLKEIEVDRVGVLVKGTVECDGVIHYVFLNNKYAGYKLENCSCKKAKNEITNVQEVVS